MSFKVFSPYPQNDSIHVSRLLWPFNMSLIPLRSALTHAPRRTFSTTPRTLIISPESPSYIEISRPPTVRSSPPPRQKGKLPHPKSIRHDISALSATPEPSPESLEPTPGLDAETTAYIKWKNRLAETRRRNLREGISELQERQKNQAARRAEVLKKRSEDREALLAAKQREDVRLTLPSVLSTLRLDDASSMIRITPERLAEKQAICAAKEAEKSAARIEIFHELYLNARDFIVTEKQLDEAIEREFVQKDHLYKTLPQTVEDMLLQVQSNQGNFSRDPKMMEIAGQLTGAKLVPERKGRRDNGAFGVDDTDDGLITREFGQKRPML